MAEHDLTFDAMGSHVRLLIGEPGPGMPPAAGGRRAGAALRRRLRRGALALQARERALRAERRPARAGARLRAAAHARSRPGSAAAERSDGLVDPTLVGEIEAAGYVASRAGMPGAPLAEALAEAPARRAGAARGPTARWRELRGRRRGRGDRPPAGRCASTPAAPARAWPPTWSPTACAATRASSSTAAATSASAAPTRSSTPTRSSSSTR